MSRTFTRERCIPWLCSRAGVRLEDEPQEVAPDVDELRARVRPRAALGLRIAGVIGLLGALALTLGSSPARPGAAATGPSRRSLAGYALAGLSVGAFVIGRRLSRHAPALAVLCAGRDADLDTAPLAALAAGARRRLVEGTCSSRHVWLISEASLSHAHKRDAAALEVRCFAPVDGRITEV